MESQEQQEVETGEPEVERAASKFLTHEELPWFFEAASQVYRNHTLRYLAYARLALYVVCATALAIVAHPLVAAVVGVAAIAYERDYLHRLSLQHQLMVASNLTMRQNKGLEFLDGKRQELEVKVNDLTQRFYDHLAEAEGLLPENEDKPILPS